jgi:hypothetical protein
VTPRDPVGELLDELVRLRAATLKAHGEPAARAIGSARSQIRYAARQILRQHFQPPSST